LFFISYKYKDTVETHGKKQYNWIEKMPQSM